MLPPSHQTTLSTSTASSTDVESSEPSSSRRPTLVGSPTPWSGDFEHTKGHDNDKFSTDPLIKTVRRPSLLDDDEQPISAAAATAVEISNATSSSGDKGKQQPVTWMSLPEKGQLAVLTLARLSEPLSERSLSAYMFYQLRSFDPTLPDSTITSQGGMLTAAFAGAQFLTAVWWGRAADTPWIGRKRVLLIGLFGTAVASIGVGFSTSFVQALCFRALAGALNGNVGVMRTMISEIIKEKKFQARAFLLLPMCFNIGVIIGPIMGGFLADPIHSFPDTFGPGSPLGGKDGVAWMNKFPYGLPNLFSGFFIALSALTVILGLNETHEALRNKPDYGRQLGKWLVRAMRFRKRPQYSYTQLTTNEDETELADTSTSSRHKETDTNIEHDPMSRPSSPEPGSNKSSPSLALSSKPRSPFRAILRPNILLTLLAHHLMALHISSFNALIFLFLPNPRSPNPPSSIFTLRFSGGLGLSSPNVGLATAIIGIIGFPLQVLVYPPLQAKLGTLRGYRLFLPFSAVAYTLLPFLVLVPNKPYIIWPALTLVLSSQVLSRTFATTSTVILVNNSSPGPEALGTVHGVAQSVSSAARMLGPTVGGWGLGLGLKSNCVGAVWWAMAGLVGIHWGLLWCIYEGDGRGGRA